MLGGYWQLRAIITPYSGDSLCSVMGKHALRSLLVSYPKKDWRAGPCKSLFWYNTDYTIVITIRSLCCLRALYSVVSVIPKEGLEGPCPPILFWYDNEKDLEARFPMARLIQVTARADEALSGNDSHAFSQLGPNH